MTLVEDPEVEYSCSVSVVYRMSCCILSLCNKSLLIFASLQANN